MTCNACGAAVTTVDSTGSVKSGWFEEQYECANGHVGWVSGQAETPPIEWRKRGSVFKA